MDDSMCESANRVENTLRREKRYAIEIAGRVLDSIEENPDKLGVVLCEGKESSIDKAIYSRVYPDFIIIPVGGCTDVTKLLFRIKKLLPEYECYGLIDRDFLSKSEIKRLRTERGIYTTKLPFIENIICVPEVVKILCSITGKKYDEIIKGVRSKLMSLLCKQIRTSLPINIYISTEALVKRIEINMTLENGKARKVVDDSNILYTLRSKAVASEIADVLGITGRKNYYEKIKELLQDEKIGEKLVMYMSNYLPRIP